MDEPEETIEATKRSIAVLETLADAPRPMGVTAIADRTTMTKSTVYKHLRTLVELGYVERTDGEYELSIRALDLGTRVRWDTDVIPPIKESVDDLAEMADEVAGVVVEHDGTAVDVHCARQHRTGTHPAYNVRHLHCSAAGKALLAAEDDDRVRSIVAEHGCPALTERTITTEEELLAELDRIRERGFALERREQFSEVNSVAVRVPTEAVSLSIYVSGQADELSGKRFEENIPGILLSTGRRLASTLS